MINFYKVTELLVFIVLELFTFRPEKTESEKLTQIAFRKYFAKQQKLCKVHKKTTVSGSLCNKVADL